MRISVIVPTYNEAKGIEKFLRQFKYQTLPRNEFEIIVVDGHSSDNTREIAQKYADKVIPQKSEGVGGARNDGVKIANAEIIATTDADTLLSRTWLTQYLSHFERDENIILVYGASFPITKRPDIHFFAMVKRWMNIVGTGLGLIHFSEGTNTAFRKRQFLEVGGYSDLPFLDDMEITFRLKKKGKIVYDGTIFVYSSIRRVDKVGVSKIGLDGIKAYIQLFSNRKMSSLEQYKKQTY